MPEISKKNLADLLETAENTDPAPAQTYAAPPDYTPDEDDDDDEYRQDVMGAMSDRNEDAYRQDVMQAMQARQQAPVAAPTAAPTAATCPTCGAQQAVQFSAVRPPAPAPVQ
jgi:hypothetical protein